VPISQGSWEGFDEDEVEALWRWRTSYRGVGSERRVLLSIELPNGTRHNFEMDTGVAHTLAAALAERADAEGLAVDSPV
jgi:hypothetical protein